MTPSVYAALWDGHGQYLIARKRCFNQWWGENAAAVLTAEASAAAVQAAQIPNPQPHDWNATTSLLAAACRAALSAWHASLPELDLALQHARQAVAQPASRALAATTAAQAVVKVFTLVKYLPLVGASSLPSQVDAAVNGTGLWATAQATAATLAGSAASASATRQPGVVHQAGQWALPGGGLHPGEAVDVAARREFAEETGQSLADTVRFAIDLQLDIASLAAPQYSVVRLQVTDGTPLATLAADINRAIRPRPANFDRPDGAGVTDWELDLVRVVASDDLPRHLGVYQALAPSAIAIGAGLPPASPARLNFNWQEHYHHLIDWYAWVALQLMTA
ncbi:NUDIX domain-containing protein [Eleftheria terrae]|uniref:NUDIX domain-containing protein n=1 Tax=Eleftheria terrae TaxID=1597781 RepID=UPI00263A83D0|nr:NUDIX domain-containing protein [Eleftheria terrae]WKB55636.1 NUDIX domain-containing protein [Eleftheria terrae]